MNDIDLLVMIKLWYSSIKVWIFLSISAAVELPKRRWVIGKSSKPSGRSETGLYCAPSRAPALRSSLTDKVSNGVSKANILFWCASGIFRVAEISLDSSLIEISSKLCNSERRGCQNAFNSGRGANSFTGLQSSTRSLTFAIPFFSIWRIRSRVTSKRSANSCSV